MAKILRKAAKVFASGAGVNQIAQFGSLAAGSPAFTTDPDVIQALSNYLTGWFGAVIGANSPAEEDMNAILYLLSYQVAYLLQTGIGEWNSTTTYYIGSFVSSGSKIYVSLTDTNLNHAVTDATNWKPVGGALYDPGVQTSAYSLGWINDQGVVRLDSTGGVFNLQLPNPTTTPGLLVKLKDVGGGCNAYPITLVRFSTEKIEELAANFLLDSCFGTWSLYCDGTNWHILD